MFKYQLCDYDQQFNIFARRYMISISYYASKRNSKMSLNIFDKTNTERIEIGSYLFMISRSCDML
jgi:hypothetical protein